MMIIFSSSSTRADGSDWRLIGEKAMINIKSSDRRRKVDKIKNGPYELLYVYRNGTVIIRRGNYAEDEYPKDRLLSVNDDDSNTQA